MHDTTRDVLAAQCDDSNRLSNNDVRAIHDHSSSKHVDHIQIEEENTVECGATNPL